MKLAGALVAQPDQNVCRVRPEKRTDSSGYLQRVIDAQPLQSLNIKHAVVKLAFSTVVPMNTLPLAKHLFGHDESPISRAAARNTKAFVSVSGCQRVGELACRVLPMRGFQPGQRYYITTMLRVAPAFENFIQVRKITFAMLRSALLASRNTPFATLLPFVSQHGVSDSA